MSLQSIFLKHYSDTSQTAQRYLQGLRESIKTGDMKVPAEVQASIRDFQQTESAAAKERVYNCLHEIAKEIPELRTSSKQLILQRLEAEAQTMHNVLTMNPPTDQDLKGFKHALRPFLNRVFERLVKGEEESMHKVMNILATGADAGTDLIDSLGLVRESGLKTSGKDIQKIAKEAFDLDKKKWDFGLDINGTINTRILELIFFIWHNTHPNQFHNSMLIDGKAFTLDNNQRKNFLESIISKVIKNKDNELARAERLSRSNPEAE